MAIQIQSLCDLKYVMEVSAKVGRVKKCNSPGDSRSPGEYFLVVI